jgi:hypothetical protein
MSAELKELLTIARYQRDNNNKYCEINIWNPLLQRIEKVK